MVMTTHSCTTQHLVVDAKKKVVIGCVLLLQRGGGQVGWQKHWWCACCILALNQQRQLEDEYERGLGFQRLPQCLLALVAQVVDCCYVCVGGCV